MADDSGKKLTNPSDTEYASKTWDILASIGIAAITYVPIPPSIIKSLRKTADRFICGASDYGMTYIEGATARRKSFTEGKQMVMREAALAAASRVTNDEHLMERALDVFASELIVKQINKEKVLTLAVSELNTVKTFDTSERVIDDDWLGEFSILASKKSNEDVQQLLAKILAGEIRHPGTFSPLTLHILSTLTPEIAKSFEIFCNLCVEWEPDEGGNLTFLCHKPYPGYMRMGLPEFGITFGDFLILQNYGLLTQRLDAEFYVSEPILEVTIEVGGSRLSLKSKTGNPIDVNINPITPLSISGTELRRIISLKVPPEHLKRQIEYFDKLGFNVITQ